MYTLRLFKNGGDVKDISLGEVIVRKQPDEKDNQELKIILRVFGNTKASKDGITIYEDDNAFIVSPNGDTLTTINRSVFTSE